MGSTPKFSFKEFKKTEIPFYLLRLIQWIFNMAIFGGQFPGFDVAHVMWENVGKAPIFYWS
jgi:hypothetical protein